MITKATALILMVCFMGATMAPMQVVEPAGAVGKLIATYGIPIITALSMLANGLQWAERLKAERVHRAEIGAAHIEFNTYRDKKEGETADAFKMLTLSTNRLADGIQEIQRAQRS